MGHSFGFLPGFATFFAFLMAISQAAPPRFKVILTIIRADMMCTVMDCPTRAGFKSLQVEFHTEMNETTAWLKRKGKKTLWYALENGQHYKVKDTVCGMQ